MSFVVLRSMPKRSAVSVTCVDCGEEMEALVLDVHRAIRHTAFTGVSKPKKGRKK